jgi:hypothetical protein
MNKQISNVPAGWAGGSGQQPSTERGTPMTAKKTAHVSLVVALLTVLFIVVGSNVGSADPANRALIGSWLETVTFPPEIRPPIKALSTFHEDGTITISDQGSVTTAGPMPGVFTAGHGVWAHVEDRTFAYTQLELISDLSGNLVGYLKVRGTLIVSESGNEWADGSRSFAEVLDTDGNVLFSVWVTNVAQRIRLELPPPAP